jgi:hypothetical protein
MIMIMMMCSCCCCFCRNFFLDFDTNGHLSSLEQNFNPSREDVKRKTALGKKNKSIFCVC